MGRSTVSCFRIMTCGRESVDTRSDVEAPEIKVSSDTRGWSFGKRSARHRVLSNTVITETSSSSNKESPQTITANVQTQLNTNLLEKTSAIPCTDEIPKLTSVNSKVCDTEASTEGDKNHNVKPDEVVIVVIQTSIRRFLAQKEMLKLKSIVKLQSVVRGHLVRRHAVGTLRCVQAIIKMQALVRGHRARLLSEGSCTKETLDQSHVKNNCSSKLLRGNSVTKPVVTYTSTEKLLGNKFAHKLLESPRRSKHIHIKCDPFRSDSAWMWLERWMSVSSREVEQPQKAKSTMKHQNQEEETGFPSEDCESADLKANTLETIALSCKSEAESHSNNSDFQACKTSSSFESENLERTQHASSSLSNSKEIPLGSLTDQTKQSEPIFQVELKPYSIKSETANKQSQMELKSNSSKHETENVQSTQSGKKFYPEQTVTEGKKFLFGTRKASNPAFIAVHSKFEELSSTANSVRSTISCNKDVGAESNSNSISSAVENAIGTMGENLVLHNSRVKVGRSESGTELSITSTLDSPDGSEHGEIEMKQEANVSEMGFNNLNGSKNLDIEVNDKPSILKYDLQYFISDEPEKLDDGANGESITSVTALDLQGNQKSEAIAYNGSNGEPTSSTAALDSLLEKQRLTTNPSILPIEMELAHTDKSSPDASPRSHVTGPDFQTTPSSQVSVKGEKTRSGIQGYNRKRKSLSAVKQSPSNPNPDSGATGSLEKLDKDHKTGKRRNSFGSGRSENFDQEPRDSSNSIPSYMQATKSARAKALANSSPRSSPDVHDKDIFVKRHSLPGANGRQGSPRVQRSTSHSQQCAKGNSNSHGIF